MSLNDGVPYLGEEKERKILENLIKQYDKVGDKYRKKIQDGKATMKDAEKELRPIHNKIEHKKLQIYAMRTRR